jgi:hypothetical protein
MRDESQHAHVAAAAGDLRELREKGVELWKSKNRRGGGEEEEEEEEKEEEEEEEGEED